LCTIKRDKIYNYNNYYVLWNAVSNPPLLSLKSHCIGLRLKYRHTNTLKFASLASAFLRTLPIMFNCWSTKRRSLWTKKYSK